MSGDKSYDRRLMSTVDSQLVCLCTANMFTTSIAVERANKMWSCCLCNSNPGNAKAVQSDSELSALIARVLRKYLV